MKIVKFVFPPLDNNIYIVYDEKNLEGYIIDVALGAYSLAEFVRKNKLKIISIINTHAHIDHTAHNFILRKLIKTKVGIHKDDYPLLKEFFNKEHLFINEKLEYEEPDFLFDENYTFKFGNYELKVIHTPGHTPGSVCLYEEKQKVLFSGDTLFAGTYGRVDFPYSDEKEMLKSLRKLAKLPKEVKVYSGHYEETKIEFEHWLNEI